MNGLIMLALASLVVDQGQAVEIRYPAAQGLKTAEVSWGGRTIPMWRSADAWVTIIGVDLDASVGEHRAELALSYEDGTHHSDVQTIEVRHKAFPLTKLTVEPKYVELSAEDQARADRESHEIAAIYARLTPTPLWREPFLAPLPGVVGGRNFGHRRVFNDQPRAPHSGADLSAATGTEVHAANRGRVVLAKNLFFSGNAIFIDHGLGLYSTYLHLSAMRVVPGDLVERGQVIGLAGATGRVTGPHLHWGVRVLDARVDPFSLLSLPPVAEP
jgi:murein DD-endopeptidase MepM/ murein hydrolase activator NlpD